MTLLPPAEPLSEGQIPIRLDSTLGCLDSFPKDVGADGGEASAGLERSADILVCEFTGLLSPVFLGSVSLQASGTGDWKVARTRRLESLR